MQSRFSNLSHEFRHFNICFTFGRVSNSSTNLPQLPPIPSRVQECNHTAFVKKDSWSNLPSQPGDCAEIPSQGSPHELCPKKKTVAIVTSSLPALNRLSLPSQSSLVLLVPVKKERVRSGLRSVLGAGGARGRHPRVLTHQVVLACSFRLPEDVLREGCYRCHFVTEPCKSQRNRLFAFPSHPQLAVEPYC